ncbi:hypothetical protein MIND_00846100 [Mycena indigotica]|uniref:Uncharacterized protein n=1 Tax=Mycena indigotica TaxID=2126181 RepID=A0A8H6VYM6_9AGAR|nr:uncharacterized protein MIND_00846100 [Mycena indigotica]KAF7298979.1 hypothetical protein MIND_00846100 [Mycena indigotica]
MRVCRQGTRTSEADGFVKLSSRVVATDAGRWKMDVFNPETRQQVSLPIQVKIGNGYVDESTCMPLPNTFFKRSPDQAHQPFWTRQGNFTVFPCHHTHYGPPTARPPMMYVWIKVGNPGVPVYYRLSRE